MTTPTAEQEIRVARNLSDMFRADPDADQTRRDPRQHRKPLQQTHRQRRLYGPAMLERPSEKQVLNHQLAALNQAASEARADAAWSNV